MKSIMKRNAKYFIQIIIFALTLAGCAGNSAESTGNPLEEDANASPTAALADLGPAPELENEIWLNTEQPLHLAELRGRVVLLEMWTFG